MEESVSCVCVCVCVCARARGRTCSSISEPVVHPSPLSRAASTHFTAAAD